MNNVLAERLKVQFEILNTSIVVLASQHNPSILHPSFLQSQGIVPNDWETLEPPICTPVFASVKYQNGIVFTVEQNKFQVIDNQTKDNFDKSLMPELVIRYCEHLPHVHYNAVGINFDCFMKRIFPCLNDFGNFPL